jgi:hypothetical protein
MEFTAAIFILRYGAHSLLHQLECLPPERRDWKPHPDAKSGLEIAGEVASALQLYLPLVRGTDWEFPPRPHPTTLEEARELVTSAVEDYVAALEAAGPELNRPVDMPFGATFWGPHAAIYPAIEVQHHHGQICYIQSLLGDKEMHWDEEAIAQHFTYDPSRHTPGEGGPDNLKI